MKKYFLFLLLWPFVTQLNAQVIKCGVSPNGIVLHYEGPIESEKIELFRNGQPIGSLKLKKNGLDKSLETAETFWKIYPHVEDSLIPKIAASVSSAKSTETLYLGYYLTVKQACGLAFTDKEGTKEDVYTARMNEMDIVTLWDRKDASFIEPAVQPEQYQSYLGDIESGWIVNTENRLFFTRLFRRNTDSAFYRLVPTAKFRFSNLGDSLMVIAADTSLPYLSYFSYVMVGYDFYTNPSRQSAPLMADNLDGSTRPLLLGFTAKEENGKVFISWKVKNSSRVKSLLLFRSNYSDSAFALISQLSASDSVFQDVSVNPMEPVYYRLVLYDLKGLITDAPVVPMVSHAKPEVLPPAVVQSGIVNTEPVITWSQSDPGARGFYVYRTDVIGYQPERVSGFIQKGVEPYQWTDTSSWLKPGKSYHYSIQAESQGYLMSDFSTFVSVEIPNNIPPATPAGMVGRKMENGSVLLVWNTHGRQQNDPLAFFVYRSTKKDGPYERITEEPIFGENSYLDMPSPLSDTLYYAVSSLSPEGKESAQCLPVRMLIRPGNWGVRFILGKEVESGFEISWPLGEPGITQFELERSIDRAEPSVLATLDSTAAKYIDNNVKSGQVYAYRLISIDALGKRSMPSEWIVMGH